MPQISKNNRDQLQMIAIDEHVAKDSLARIIDVFIDSADLEQLGFVVKGKSKEGRPAFPADVLSKLYLYGYLHGIRSSRKLEHACKVNIELWWLLQFQKPRYKTIADFRKNNATGFANLFIHFRDFSLQQGLYGKKTIAIDGSKFRAQNSKKNNYNDRKINKHLEYIDIQYQEYLHDLDNNDKSEQSNSIKLKLDERREKYEDLKEQLNNSDQTQISTSDTDARALPLHMRIVEVGYNLQSAVDDKHKLIVDYQITNKNDHRALAPMALKAKKALNLDDKDRLIVLADKGYHTGEQMQICHDNNIDTLVAVPKKPKQTDQTKPPHLRKESFLYNYITDTYICPNGQTLNKQARYKRHNRKGQLVGEFDRYTIKFSFCKNCQYLQQCVAKGNRTRSQGRYIDRYLTDGAVQKNKSNLANNRKLYKKRQAIVEHPFGTIKRQWGFTYTLLKTIPKVQTEFSIIMLAYNLKRSISILGHIKLKKAIKRSIFNICNTSAAMKNLTNSFYIFIHLPSQNLSQPINL